MYQQPSPQQHKMVFLVSLSDAYCLESSVARLGFM